MLTALAFGIFGLIVGSFLNVLIIRRGNRPLTGRSSCAACGKVLAWYDLVPLLSWIALYGRCRYCGNRISLQYPLVEALTALVFIGIGLSPLWLPLKLLGLAIASLLIAIAVYDLRTTYIPDPWVLTFAALALLNATLPVAIRSSADALVFAVLSGFAVALPLFAVWLFSRGAWMGFGDVKLSLGMGWLLGMTGGFLALFLAFMIGGIVSAPLLFFSSALWARMRRRFTPTEVSRKRGLGFTMKSEIPFGPFLITATFIVWLSNMYGFQLPQLFL